MVYAELTSANRKVKAADVKDLTGEILALIRKSIEEGNDVEN